MTPAAAALVIAAGLAGGLLNTLAGGGTLVTFPVLLTLGYPPLVAAVTNSAGLLAGSAAGARACRQDLPSRGEMIRLSAAALAGGAAGAALLLTLPPQAFTAAVPWLIGLACLLMLAKPILTRRGRHARRGRAPEGPALLGVFCAAAYGGYFSAAQGIVCIAVLGAVRPWPLRKLNAAKNVLATIVLTVAVACFAAGGHVAWTPVALLAAGSMAGGPAGAWLGRRTPSFVLRSVVVAVGAAAIARVVL